MQSTSSSPMYYNITTTTCSRSGDSGRISSSVSALPHNNDYLLMTKRTVCDSNSGGSSSSSSYVAMNSFGKPGLVIESRYKNNHNHNDNDHDGYKVPSSLPRPVSFAKLKSPSSESMPLFYCSSPLTSPPLPLSPPPPLSPMRSARWVCYSNTKPVLVPVRPPQVPEVSTIRTVTKVTTTATANSVHNNSSSSSCCNVCKRSNLVTGSPVKRALNELSELIGTTTEHAATRTLPASTYGSRTTLPIQSTESSSSSFYTTPLVPGYVQPISKEWEDVNRKLNALVINVKAQNKKIDEIRRVCAERDEYVTFNELGYIMGSVSASSSTQSSMCDNSIVTAAAETQQPLFKRSTLPYTSREYAAATAAANSVRGVGNKNKHPTRTWGQRILSYVKIGRNKQ